MNRNPALLVGAVVLLACWAGAARADGVVRDGIGAISIGRGGTNIAAADNGAILLDNPAAIGNVDGSGLFEASLDGLETDLHYTNPISNSHNRHIPIALPFLSYIYRPDGGDWAFGIGAFAPAGFGAEYDIKSPAFDFQRYKSFGALVKVEAGVAYHVTDHLVLGGTFGVGVSNVALQGPFFLQTGALRGVPTLLNLQAGIACAPVWSLGAQYDIDEKTRVGVSYTAETLLHFNGHSTVEVPPVPGLTPVPLYTRYDTNVRLVWPRSFGGGITHTFGDHHRASCDVIYYDWSRSFDRVDVRFSNPSNPVFSALAGPTVKDSFPLNWRDTVSFRLGYEYLFDGGDVFRLGYIYHRQPIPNETLTPYIPATLEHAFDIGYGKQWNNWSVNVAYQYSFGPELHVPVSGLAGGDFNNSQIEAAAHWLTLSIKRDF